LDSTSIVTDDAGNVVSEMRYKACPLAALGMLREGEVRHESGAMPTKYQYTGQYSDSYINLLWYNSRHYDPELGRFISPDTIVPLASQGEFLFVSRKVNKTAPVAAGAVSKVKVRTLLK
jgi:RHS repeat-associated protein